MAGLACPAKRCILGALNVIATWRPSSKSNAKAGSFLASAFAAHQCLATEPDGSGMRRFGLHKRRLRANSSGMQDHSTLAMLALLVGAWVIVVAVGWWLQ